MGITTFIAQEGGSPAALLQKMADIIEGTRPHLPLWLGGTLPSDPEVLKGYIIDWLRNHATELQGIGKDAGRGLVHILLGMVVGAIVALHQARPPKDSRPLAAALTLRAARLGNAFRRIVFAQVRIAALNACLTGLYLEGGLRLSGIDLPFSKTLIVLTFFIGLIPVLGNLVTNTIIVVVSLSVSVPVATASLVFLILIHKLEYFLNARIVGGQIDAHSWELLIAMNSCGHHHVGHIGILGVDKGKEEWYQITLGGRQGNDARLGKVLGPSIPGAEVPDAVETIIRLYIDNRQEGESFLQTLDRIGTGLFKETLFGARLKGVNAAPAA